MRKIYGFFCGTTRFSFPPERASSVLSFLLSRGIGTLTFDAAGEEGRLLVLSRDAETVNSCADCKRVEDMGLWRLIRSFFLRPGLVVGVFLGILLLILSSLTVWRIEVSGNTELSADEITHALSRAGLSVGDFIPRADLPAVKTRVLQANPEIGWIGLYIRGTTVAVEVRESARVGETHLVNEFRNLIAREDGIIETVSAKAGRAVVRSGMSVKAGELLISGIYRTAGGLRTVPAEGEVLARVNRVIAVTEPRVVTKKEEGEPRTWGLSVDFFGKEIKLFQKTSKKEEKYDIISERVQWQLPGGIVLPIYTQRTVCLPYEEASWVRDEGEISAAAYARLREEIASATAGAVVIGESIEEEWTEEGLRLVCRYTCVADIADPSAYDVEK